MSDGDLTDRAALEAAVRQVADEYLKDPNINSVGLGYKLVLTRRTGLDFGRLLQAETAATSAPEAVAAAAGPRVPGARRIRSEDEIVV